MRRLPGLLLTVVAGPAQRARGLLRCLLIAGSLAILALVTAFATPAAATDTDGVNSEPEAVAYHPNWMSWIPDETNLLDISIPATHDSATATCEPIPVAFGFCRTQSMTLDEQLDSGVRGFDIRIRGRNNDTADTSDDYFSIAHGAIDILKPGTPPVPPQEMTLEDVFSTACGFLTAQPTETLIMQIGDLGLADRHDPDVSLIDLFDDYANRYSACLHAPDASGDVPTLGQARGKIVLAPRTSGEINNDNDRFDNYGYPSRSGGEDVIDAPLTDAKLEARVLQALQVIDRSQLNANDRLQGSLDKGSFYFAYLNANTGAEPLHFASGLALEGINEKFVEFLLGLDDIDGNDGLLFNRLGVVFSDYPSASLIESVIAHNFDLAVYPHLHRGTAQQALTSFSHHVRENEGTDTPNLNSKTADFWRHVLRDDDNVHVFTTQQGPGWPHSNVSLLDFEITSAGVRGFTHQVFVTPPGSAPVSSTDLVAAVNRIPPRPNLPPDRFQEYILEEIQAEFPDLGVSVHVPSASSALSTLVPWTVTGTTSVAVVWVYEPTIPVPILRAGGPYIFTPDTPTNVTACNTTNPRGDVLNYRWRFGATGVFTNWSPDCVSRLPGAPPGEYALTLEVESSSIGFTQAKTTTVQVPLRRPNLVLNEQDRTRREGDLFTLSGSADLPGTLVFDFGDDTIRTVVKQPGDPLSFSQTHRYLDEGVYEASVSFTADGALSPTRTVTNTVLNVTPSLTVTEVTGNEEGGTMTIRGTINDPGLDSLTMVYGIDGTLYSASFGPTDRTFELTHPVVDDDPTGTPVDAVPFEYQIFDNGAIGEGEQTVDFINVAPTVIIDGAVDEDGESIIGNPIAPGAPIRLTASFEDPGILDTHLATIDLGDGPAPVGITDGLIDATFSFSEAGEYTVHVSVTDDDTGVGTASVVIHVRESEPAEAVLLVAHSITDLIDEPDLPVRAKRRLESANRRLVGSSPNSPNSVVARLDRGEVGRALRLLYLAVRDLERADSAGAPDTTDLRLALTDLARHQATTQVEAAEARTDSNRDVRTVARARWFIAKGDDQLTLGNERTAALRFWQSVRQSERVR